MIILSIDASGGTAGCAVTDDQHTVAEYAITNQKTHSQNLMTMIDQMLETADISQDQIDYIACAQGPGSFTGLRIGAAAAKAIAHSLRKPMVPVPTLDSLAYNIYSPHQVIVPVMDARRNQVYTAFYRCMPEGMERISAYLNIEMDRVLVQAVDYGNVVFLGDAVPLYREKILNSGFSTAPAHLCLQRAGALGQAALERIQKGQEVSCFDFSLLYLRKPQAERERLERELNSNSEAGGETAGTADGQQSLQGGSRHD